MIHVSSASARTRWSNLAGIRQQEAQRVAKSLLPDILRFDHTRPAAYPNNGRALTDDVMAVFLPILTNGTAKSDGLTAHRDLLAEFPY